MNPQLVQALMQTLQQAMQLIQQASGAQADPTQNPAMAAQGAEGADGVEPEEDDDQDFETEASMDDEGGDGEGEDDMSNDAGGGADSLHDRISKLETHTGLSKSASNTPILQRLDALEMQWLGEEYEGSVVARVQQLEKAAGLTKSAATKRRTPKTSTARTQPVDEAPDVIPLETLIKTAISEGIAQGMREMSKQQPQAPQAELPSVQAMRKNAAQNGKPRYNQRRAQTQTVQADAELVKAAQAWGYEESELDEPVGLGDVLLAQYHTNLNGGGYLPGAGEADDDN